MTFEEELLEIEKQAQPGAFSTFDMEVFVPEVRKLNAGEIYLEVGCDKGRSLSIARLVIKPDINMYGVDVAKSPELEGYLKDHPEIEFFWMKSTTAAQVWKERRMPQIYLLFIDGDHSYQAVRADLEAWEPHLAINATILFHDADETSPGVLQAMTEFVDKHRNMKSFQLFKRTDKNTSMAKIQL